MVETIERASQQEIVEEPRERLHELFVEQTVCVCAAWAHSLVSGLRDKHVIHRHVDLSAHRHNWASSRNIDRRRASRDNATDRKTGFADSARLFLLVQLDFCSEKELGRVKIRTRKF